MYSIKYQNQDSVIKIILEQPIVAYNKDNVG